jgi:hypothetical protein
MKAIVYYSGLVFFRLYIFPDGLTLVIIFLRMICIVARLFIVAEFVSRTKIQIKFLEKQKLFDI